MSPAVGRKAKVPRLEGVAADVSPEELPAPILRMLQDRFGNTMVAEALAGGGGALGELVAMAAAQDATGQGGLASVMSSNEAMQRVLRSAQGEPAVDEHIGTNEAFATRNDPIPSGASLPVGSVAAAASASPEVGSSDSEEIVVAALSGETPSEVAVAYQRLSPSEQAATTDLQPRLSQTSGQVHDQLVAVTPAFRAVQPGVEAAPEGPAVATPSPVAPVAAHDTSPAAVVPGEAPSPEPVVPVDLDPVFTRVPEGTPAESAAAIDASLATVTSARPVVDTACAPPTVPLAGEADPAQLDAIAAGAAEESTEAVAVAGAALDAVDPATLVVPVAVDVPIEVPPVPALGPLPELPTVQGMLELEGYTLGATDRAAFDQTWAAPLQSSLDAATHGLEADQATLDVSHGTLLVEADARSATLAAEADQERQVAVDEGQAEISAACEQTRLDQQAAASDALAILDQQRQASAAEIDARISVDSARIDQIYASAEAEADVEVARGEAEATARQAEAERQAEDEGWWDWAIDAWQEVVQAVADEICAIWEAITALVAEILDAAVALAAEVARALVAFVSEVIAAYYDLWRSLVQELLGDVFPELADALCALADEIEALALQAVQAIADAFVAALEALADWVVAGMEALLAAYRAGLAAYLALWEAIQQGEWEDVGTMVLSALLTAAGIDPAEFFAIFTNIEEIEEQLLNDPGSVVRNGAAAMAQGFEQFGGGFLDHFIGASVEWLTGAVGLDMPESFDIAGVFDVTCQVLGLTYEHLREKAVEHVGEGAVEAGEKLFEGMMALVSGGWSGLWDYVKGELTSLVDDVVVAIGSWLLEKAILVVGRWVVGLFATAGMSSIVELLIAGWQMLMWCIDQFQAMYALVQSTVESVHEFVMGNIQPAADKIEGTLHGLIAPAIDLVAKLLNISNIADRVQEIIEGVRGMIDDAIDAAFEAVLVGLGLKSTTEEGEAGEADALEDGQLGAELSFVGGDHDHRLWVELTGDSVRLMVASTPTQVRDFVARLSDDETKRITGAEGYAGQIETASSLADAAEQGAERIVAYLRQGEQERADNEDVDLESDEGRLIAALAFLFDHLDEAGSLEMERALIHGRIDDTGDRLDRADVRAAANEKIKHTVLGQTEADRQSAEVVGVGLPGGDLRSRAS